MERIINEFIERKNERKNSANAKLKLLIYGVRDNPEIFLKFQKYQELQKMKRKLVTGL